MQRIGLGGPFSEPVLGDVKPGGPGSGLGGADFGVDRHGLGEDVAQWLGKLRRRKH